MLLLMFTETVLLGQVSPVPPDWFTAIIQAGSFGLIAYIVIFAFPQWQRDHRAELRAQQETYERALLVMQSGFKERSTELKGAIDKQTDELSKRWDSHAGRVEKAMAYICHAESQRPDYRGPKPT